MTYGKAAPFDGLRAAGVPTGRLHTAVSPAFPEAPGSRSLLRSPCILSSGCPEIEAYHQRYSAATNIFLEGNLYFIDDLVLAIQELPEGFSLEELQRLITIYIQGKVRDEGVLALK